MLYRLFLYKTTAAVASAPAIGIVNDALSTNSEREWNGNGAADFLEYFDTASIVRIIEAELTELDSDRCKCKASTRFPPKKYKQVPFIYVATSYKNAIEVLPKLHAIAAKYDLALYDAETDKTFYRDLVDRTFITMRLRQQVFHNEILNTMKPVWKIQKVSSYSDERDKSCDYVVTLKKDPKNSFEDRVKEFYRCLSNRLADDEELRCEDRCYKIVGKWYQITYTLEGYKKHANRIGYKSCCTGLLKRMGTDEAFRWLKGCSEKEVNDVFKRMNFNEMQRAYPNPADRFVASVNITKWQRKQLFDICYSGIGYYGSEIIFHVVPDDFYQDSANISVLKIEEESASFILPFVDDIYPDFYTRYYLEENHLPIEMWGRIVDRLEEAKKLILHDTFAPELTPYIDRFNLYVLAHSDADYAAVRNNPCEFLYEHRYDVAYLYDVFIQWSKSQFEEYWNTGDGRLLNIQGP